MRIEIILFLITAFIVGNIYTDGKFVKMALSWKKYYKMAAVVVGALFIYWMFKKSPMSPNQMIATTNEYLKYMPIDSGTSQFISPILDFTSKQNFFGDADFLRSGAPIHSERRLMNSGGNSANRNNIGGMGTMGATSSDNTGIGFGKTKRSVSETKKKFVASRQNWNCGDCNKQLNAWFEVDHKIRLEHGGSNHVDNLVALCRECHGKKTTIENL
jgi:hypothetical protein